MTQRTNTHHLLLLALLWSLLSGCQPGPTEVVSPTVERAITAPVASTATPSATPVPSTETPLPTSEPMTAPLSADGPWLVYLHYSYFAGESGLLEEFVIVNADGSDRSVITPQRDSYFYLNGDNSKNYMLSLNGRFYVFRPSEDKVLNLNNLDYNGDVTSGLLAINSRELFILELPSGIVRARISLVKCPTQMKSCEERQGYFDDVNSQQPQWSPNGRYLAFSAIMETMSSDLYVYDSVDGSLRQLTNGPDWVGKYWWSPDGSTIIMEEIVMPWNDDYKQEEYFYLSPIPASSLWAVSVSNNAIRRLDSIHHNPGGVLDTWLDNTRFLFYDGPTMGVCCSAESGYHLRLIDLVSGKVQMLYDEELLGFSLIQDTEQVLVYGGFKDRILEGNFLVSIKTGIAKPVGQSFLIWDKRFGVYLVEGETCKEDAQKAQAVDINGEFKCMSIPTPAPTPAPETLEPVRHPAPEGKAIISVKDGIWLETEGQPAVQISSDAAIDVIWCPDASCVFYSVRQESGYNLYRVSLPDLAIQLVDEGIQTTGTYQWLGGK